MTRKDFIAIANILKENRSKAQTMGDPTLVSWIEMRDSFATFLRGCNPMFDRDRFIKACNGERH